MQFLWNHIKSLVDFELVKYAFTILTGPRYGDSVHIYMVANTPTLLKISSDLCTYIIQIFNCIICFTYDKLYWSL